jgi:integrase
VKIRRAIVDGTVGPPKSKHSRRDVPLPADLVRELRKLRMAAAASADDDLVFQTKDGKPLNVRNVRRRHLAPAMKAAGAPWAGYHSLRHTCASMLFERGANVRQVASWLGHSDPSFTLRVYVSLLGDDLGAPLDLASELRPADTPADTKAV